MVDTAGAIEKKGGVEMENLESFEMVYVCPYQKNFNYRCLFYTEDGLADIWHHVKPIKTCRDNFDKDIQVLLRIGNDTSVLE